MSTLPQVNLAPLHDHFASVGRDWRAALAAHAHGVPRRFVDQVVADGRRTVTEALGERQAEFVRLADRAKRRNTSPATQYGARSK